MKKTIINLLFPVPEATEKDYEAAKEWLLKFVSSEKVDLIFAKGEEEIDIVDVKTIKITFAGSESMYVSKLANSLTYFSLARKLSHDVGVRYEHQLARAAKENQEVTINIVFIFGAAEEDDEEE